MEQNKSYPVIPDHLKTHFPACPVFQLRHLFDVRSGEMIMMQDPTDSQRREFFQDLLLCQAVRPPASRKQAGKKERDCGKENSYMKKKYIS